ncbi:hypothetical protein [Deinococcus petrolearius]|uniref:Uncharacterized protein n=1 Tax=Deinococcus petrolearius TaxID=1751295 RepID=A0ABW1DM20_9DEIO
MIYVNAVMFAAFAAFFCWDESRVLPTGDLWQSLGAGLGAMAAVTLLLRTLRPLYTR